MIEDEESIQYALMEIINALMKNTIDLKRATLILRALHIAVKNASRVKFEIQGINSVKQIPNYAPPPDNADFNETAEIDFPYNAWVPQKSERQITEEKARAQKAQEFRANQTAIRESLERASLSHRQQEAHRVATAAIDCPAKANPSASVGADQLVRPGREATVPAATTAPVTQPATVAVPPHNYQPTMQPVPQPRVSAPSARKPPQPAIAVLKEQKNSAHARPEQSRRPARHG
jgi:hypothetical protein